MKENMKTKKSSLLSDGGMVGVVNFAANEYSIMERVWHKTRVFERFR